jgi:hypothetical protein
MFHGSAGVTRAIDDFDFAIFCAQCDCIHHQIFFMQRGALLLYCAAQVYP